MKKQILYAKFIPRIFATTLDLFILSIFSTPLMRLVSSRLVLSTCKNYFLEHQVNLNDSTSLMFVTQECAMSLSAEDFFGMILLSFLMNFVIMGIYFLGSWIYFGRTIGKIITSTRIVDAETFQKPTNWQFVKRFLAYFLSFFGLWFILFSKRNQALHDKIAGTIIIKS